MEPMDDCSFPSSTFEITALNSSASCVNLEMTLVWTLFSELRAIFFGDSIEKKNTSVHWLLHVSFSSLESYF